MDAELLDQMKDSMAGRADAASTRPVDAGDLIEAPQPSPYDKLSDNVDDPFDELTLSAPIPTSASAVTDSPVETTASVMMDAVEAARAAADAEPPLDVQTGASQAPDAVSDTSGDAAQAMAQSMAERMADRMIDDARETLDALASDDTTALARLESGLDTWDHDALTDHADIAPTGNVNVLLTDEDPALSLDIFD